MRIKRKIALGVGLLFSLILLLTVVSIEQIGSLSSDSENILKNNHQTLVYVQAILKAINELPDNKVSFSIIDSYLEKQKNNITEKGERELTNHIEVDINLLKSNPKDSAVLKRLYSELYEVMNLNLAAIHLKSTVASKTSEKSILWISLLGSFCFLIALLLLVTLPGNISNPIEELTESIKQIASGNYTQRVNFEDHVDFGDLAQSFNVMAKKLFEYNESNIARLITEKKITETLVNKIHDPIIGIDRNLVITFVNDEFLSISGLTFNDTIGKPILELSLSNDLVSSIMIIDSISNISNKTSNGSNKTIYLNSSGKELYFDKEIQEISYSPNGDSASENLIGYVIILRNITKFKELDLAKTNFIATVSHEYKTPISSIKMSLQLLQNPRIGTLNEEQLKLLESIYDDTERMLKTTSDLLRVTQIESGEIQLNISEVNLIQVLMFAIEANKNLAGQRNIEIITDIPDRLPLVRVDLDKTSWILSNLVSNALNYSSEFSKIFISISFDVKNVFVAVKDTGSGIDPKYIDRIFDRYFRIPEIHQKEGTGLGLAICKEFIEAQGGKITVNSKIGEGSTFTIIFTI